MNGVLKSGIRKCLTAHPSAHWWEVMYDIVRGMRLLTSRAMQVSPHLLVFKQYPSLPVDGALKESEQAAEDWGEMLDE